MLRVLTVIGTRPEAVKLAPVVLELQKHPDYFIPQVCVTAQHREMLDQVLQLFQIVPDFDLDLMRPGQTLSELTARIISSMDVVLKENKPDLVLVQGDTTTVMAVSPGGLFTIKILVGHVEAGLRSNDRYSPFPEEINRHITGVLSNYHFAPTETARKALLAENICADNIFVTGNSVIDALQMIVKRPEPISVRALLDEVGVTNNDRRLLLVTAHRRENFGSRLENICLALKALVERNPDIVIIYPVHLNPHVQEIVLQTFKRCR